MMPILIIQVLNKLRTCLEISLETREKSNKKRKHLKFFYQKKSFTNYFPEIDFRFIESDGKWASATWAFYDEP